jgi:hypothetical protein
VLHRAPSWTFQGSLIMCSYVRIHIIITFLLTGLGGDSEETAVPSNKGCHNTRLRKQEVRFLGSSRSLEAWVYHCVRMVNITDGWDELMTLCLESKLKHQ